MKKRIAPSISLRIDYDLLDDLDKEVEQGKHPDRSKGIIHYIELGREFAALQEISKDPEKKKEFDEKLSHLINTDMITKTLETCDIELLKAIRLITDDKIKAKYHQLVIDVKKG